MPGAISLSANGSACVADAATQSAMRKMQARARYTSASILQCSKLFLVS
jgi:hypothetical protein